MLSLRFHGRGGQGTVIASKLLASAMFQEGWQVQAFPSFGAERSGAPVAAFGLVSRVEQDAQKAGIALESGSICDVLKAAIEVCRLKATQCNVRVELVCESGLRARINAALLEQAVVNLVDNAVKHSGEGQTVHVEAAHVDSGQAESEVVIRVRDHGCGIGPEHLPRLFERFYRVDKARSRKLGGTGLGLAIVKHIVNRHRGQLLIESEEGAGTTVSVWLPQAAA